MRRTWAALFVAAALAAGGCGEEEVPSTPDIEPAGGENTPMATPGVPAGASYDLSAQEWIDLDEGERLEAAEDFVDDRPEECGTGEESDPEEVADYAAASAGTDYPLNAPVAELLAEGCAAVVQSGSQDPDS